ncbi:hypothetical protein JNUCC1_00907 [Lentibacillus sp. JNUCC-1]|uniref:C45 family autoproteolytic acyltransferase/hydolase n=1 Tax=Lentibacillus sp. JNUCC-1 TaxID=2654513 RepID=UPI0012E85D33|nr:C45 family peptidase [Lentibacillus sp. JNUCC-1]MUV37101.1 hypothetical protein [Lentibacillus sp. JNUCC-1]
MNYYTDVLQYRGNHYDFGYYQGELLKHSPIISNRQKQWGPKKDRHFIVDEKLYGRIMGKFSPAILEEIHGLADALEMNLTEAYRLFGGYYREFVRSGCSIFADPDFMVRNYDSHPVGYEGRYVFYQPTDQGYAVLGPSMQITGRIDGMNEKGLVLGYNFTHSKKSGDGFLCNMIGRIILENCANVDEAIDLLKELPHRHSFSYVILDPDGESYVVEASPREVVARQSNVCTNHFHVLDEENRYRQAETRQREETILEQQQHATNPLQAFQVMNDPQYDVFSKKYDASAGTIHTAAYFPKEMKAWFAIGPNRMPVIFDFEKWLRGKDVHVKRIKGELAYMRAFVIMREL